MNLILRGLIIVVVCGLIGCGGGSPTATPTPTPTPTSVTVSYSIANSSTLTLPIAGIQFNAYLPVGVSVTTYPGTNNVKSSNLVAGSALSGLQVTTFGTYSAPIRKLKLGIMVSDKTSLQTGFQQGEVLKVIYAIDAVTPTLEMFNAANNNLPIKDLFGTSFNLETKKDVDITASLTPSISLPR